MFEPYRKIYNEHQGAIESLEHIARTQWYCKLHRIPMLNFWWKDELSKIDIDATLVDWDQFLSLIHISEPTRQEQSRMPSSA